MPDALSLKRFLAEVDTHLSPLDEQQLRSVLTGFASGLPANARAAFLTNLRELCAPQPAERNEGGELVPEIESFIADVESGMYYDGWGWDPDLRRERAFGDESWAPRMDALFTGAATAFLTGRHDLAATAHQLLFGALVLEGDEGPLYSYESSPAESLTTDLAEAGARWLRSLYEIAADAREAAASMAEAWLMDLPHGARPPSLLAVRETLPKDLEAIHAFHPYWIRELVERSGSHDQVRSALLLEAATVTGDIDALAEAALRPGPGQPHAYLDLVNALRKRGDAVTALDKCREGLVLLTGGDQDGWTAYQWASLADQAAELAPGQESVAFRIQAFTLATSTRRLVALHHAAEAHHPGSGMRAAGEAADRLAAGTPGLAHHHLANFRGQALLLAGRIDDALTLLPTAHALTNGSSDTTMTVLPYVLAISCGAVAHRDWEHTVLRTLLHGAARTGRAIFYDDDLHADDADTVFVQLLEGALREQASTASERAGWRRAARTAIDRSIHTIVGGKQRARYNDAAGLAAALAETEIIIDGESTYLDAALDTYRRHIAFRREADDVRRASVLL